MEVETTTWLPIQANKIITAFISRWRPEGSEKKGKSEKALGPINGFDNPVFFNDVLLAENISMVPGERIYFRFKMQTQSTWPAFFEHGIEVVN